MGVRVFVLSVCVFSVFLFMDHLDCLSDASDVAGADGLDVAVAAEAGDDVAIGVALDCLSDTSDVAAEADGLDAAVAEAGDADGLEVHPGVRLSRIMTGLRVKLELEERGATQSREPCARFPKRRNAETPNQ